MFQRLVVILRKTIFFIAQQPLIGQGLLIIEASLSHSDAPHWVGLLWTSDQPDAEISIWQHTTPTRERQPCPQWDSNLQSQQVGGCRPHALDRMASGMAGDINAKEYKINTSNIYIYIQC